MSYKDAIAAKGIKPLPPVSQLRTTKKRGDHVQMPGGRFIVYGEDAR